MFTVENHHLFDSRKGRGRVAAAAMSLVLVAVFLAAAMLFSPPAVERAEGGSLSGWKFCVDPGHGGADSGAVGPTGLTEKEINLKVSFKLRDLLVAEGAEVYMTRTEDVYVSISDRYDMANSLGVDRFISIHHNGYSDSSANYTVTLVSQYASQESLELANSVQAELVGELGLPNQGVWKIGYAGVLNNTWMPAILTEASFVTNPEEEHRLRDDSYLMREAQAIMRGIHMPSRINFIQPQENVVSHENVCVDLQILGVDTVDHVDLFMQGTLLESKSSAPYIFNIDTSGLGDGTYQLQALAWYPDGGSASISRDLIVANLAKRWYFAEGTTRGGFSEWLTVLNPNAEDAVIDVTYAFGAEEKKERSYRVEEESRYTIDVNREAGEEKDVSVVVNSNLPVMVERPMYFLYHDKWAGGHVSSGANQPSRTWYFAEGYTGPGFEEWLCLLNPQDQPARVKIMYMCPGGLLKEEEVVVNPWRRETIFVNQEVGGGMDVSLVLESDVPVMAERPIYFLYNNLWAGGHVSIGSNQPSRTWYFAEGYTGPGFEEWLCLLNPSQDITAVKITYQTDQGQNIERDTLIPPFSRKTIFVNQDAGTNMHLSVVVEGERPLLAERPMYHDYGDWCLGGDVGIGVKSASRHWFFAEGYTGPGFENWLCLQNPGDQRLEAEVRFHFESGEVMREDVTLNPMSRTTLYLNHMVPYQEGVAFSVHASGDVIVERPIYFRYSGWTGGHVSPGYAPGTAR